MSKEIDIEYYHQLALQKQKEHRKILANLKKKPPKNLDKIALDTLVFPPPDPPVTPIMIGLFCIVASLFFPLSILPYF